MQRIGTLLLALAVFCLCLAGCVAGADGKLPATDETAAAVQEETGQAMPEPEETQPETPAVTMPEMEMPTKPDADYQLPPGEKPGGNPVTE